MTTTFQQFTLATTERRYRESLSWSSGASRDLAAWEYVVALEEALHEALRGLCCDDCHYAAHQLGDDADLDMTADEVVREALIDALMESLDWRWQPKPGVPSPQDCLVEVADAILAEFTVTRKDQP